MTAAGKRLLEGAQEMLAIETAEKLASAIRREFGLLPTSETDE